MMRRTDGRNCTKISCWMVSPAVSQRRALMKHMRLMAVHAHPDD